MVDGHFESMIHIMCAYVDVGCNVCTKSQLVYAPNYSGGGYNCTLKFINTQTALISIPSLLNMML